jgi:hypothetical protein
MGGGFGLLSLADLLEGSQSAKAQEEVARADGVKAPHFAPRAKRCIFLFMVGGPSHIDLYDPKPELQKLHGQPLPASFGKIHSQFLESDPVCLASSRRFGRYGECGMAMSDLVPAMHGLADRIALVRSCVADSVIHAPAHYQMNTGRVIMGYPSLGSWVSYGLGTENANLPSFVVLAQPEGTPEGGAPCWGAGFLPAGYQGTLLRPRGAPILHLDPASGEFDREQQRRTIGLVSEMDRSLASRGTLTETDALEARIASYELAFRMQAAAPEAVDVSRESAATRKLYGLDEPRTADFGRRCLLARRLVERGVRFVQVYSGGGPVAMQWDAHSDIDANHEKMCGLTDQPVAALLHDLARTGLLDETLVVWGGEFGRTPVAEGGSRGRDHNAAGFSMWLAGAGVKGGVTHGATDEIGFKAVSDPVHVNDLHATILHLMGINHTQLTYLHQGRDERLTDVGGMVVKGILA